MFRLADSRGQSGGLQMSCRFWGGYHRWQVQLVDFKNNASLEQLVWENRWVENMMILGVATCLYIYV